MSDLKQLVRNVRGGRPWNVVSIATALALLEEKRADLSPSGIRDIDEVLYQRAIKFFYGYDNALVECTNKGLAHKKSGGHSKERFFDLMCEFGKTHDDLRVRSVQLECAAPVNMVYSSKLFPSWKEAMSYMYAELISRGERKLASKFDWKNIQKINAAVAKERGLSLRREKVDLEYLIEIHKEKKYHSAQIERILTVSGDDVELPKIPGKMEGDDLVEYMKMEGWMSSYTAGRYMGAHPTTLHKFARRDHPDLFRVYVHGKRRDYLVHPLLFDRYEKRETSNFEREDFLEVLSKIDPAEIYHANGISKLTGLGQAFVFEPIREGKIRSNKRGNAFLVKGKDLVNYFTAAYNEFNSKINIARAARVLGTVPSRLVRLAENGKVVLDETNKEGIVELTLSNNELGRLKKLFEEDRRVRDEFKTIHAVELEVGLSKTYLERLVDSGSISCVRNPFDDRWLITNEGITQARDLKRRIDNYKRDLISRIDKDWLSHSDIWAAGLPWESIQTASRRGEIDRQKNAFWYYSGEDIKKFIEEKYTPYGIYTRPRLFGLPVNHLVTYQLARLTGETGVITRRKMHAIRELAGDNKHQILFANTQVLVHALRLPIIVVADTYDKIDEKIIKESFDNTDLPKGKKMLLRLEELCAVADKRRLEEQEEFDLMLGYNYIAVAQAVGDIHEDEARKAKERIEGTIAKRYLPLGVKLSNKYLSMADREDRKAEIMYGLLGAVRGFGEREYRFLHYAWSTVKGHLIRVSKHYRKQPLDSEGLTYMYKMKEAYKELREVTEEPSLEAVAEKAKVPYYEALTVLRIAPYIFTDQNTKQEVKPARVLSLDAQISDDGKNLMYYISDPKMTLPDEEYLRTEIGKRVEQALDYLKPLQREIAIASLIDEDPDQERQIQRKYRLTETDYSAEKLKIIGSLKEYLAYLKD